MDLGQLLQSPAGGSLIAKRGALDWNGLAAAGAKLLPEPQIWSLFQNAVADLSISLCLHHVSRRSRDELTISAPELDAFVSRASQIEHGGSRPWLTISFDDGYEDAWHYIMTRAPRFPSVEWLLFVCPAKAEKQSGFRWDLEVNDDPTPRDVALENLRADLRSVVRLSDAHIATVEQCRLLQLYENVHLGNHTNCHFRATSLSRNQVAAELEPDHCLPGSEASAARGRRAMPRRRGHGDGQPQGRTRRVGGLHPDLPPDGAWRRRCRD